MVQSLYKDNQEFLIEAMTKEDKQGLEGGIVNVLLARQWDLTAALSHQN